MNDIFIIAEDINFETANYIYYFQGDDFCKKIFEFVKNDMKNRYDENIEFKKKYYYEFISDSIGRLLLKYKDCSCLYSPKNNYITKEIFFRKLKKY